MFETYQMRLARQAREQEELKRRNRTTRGYGNDFAVAEAPAPDYSLCMTPNDWSPSDTSCSASSD